MTFVCGPDQAFAEKAKGPTGIDWRARFSQYKRMILRFPSAYRIRLLAWYDERIFSRPTTSAVQTSLGMSESGFDEIDDLIQRLGDADVDSQFNSLSPTASMTPLLQYPASSSLAQSSQHHASLPPESDAAMSEPDIPDIPHVPDIPNAPSTSTVESETVAGPKEAKKARAPRARRVQSRKRG